MINNEKKREFTFEERIMIIKCFDIKMIDITDNKKEMVLRYFPFFFKMHITRTLIFFFIFKNAISTIHAAFLK